MKAFRWNLLGTQRTSFPEEFYALTRQKPSSPNSRISSLSPFLDQQGLLRSRGRLAKAKYLLVARYPIILDSKNPAVKLFLLHIHKSNSHASLEQSRSIVQEQFWILRCRSALKTIIHHCIPCRRITQHVDYPIMADLPDCRLPSANIFSFVTTGLDFVGPFPIKDNGQFGRRYCLLFTYLVTRAVHIETCADLNTETTLMAIRRFISLLENPQQIYSDNATTFIKASKELENGIEKLRTDNAFRDAFVLLHLDWRFIPPSSPHFGGSWESLVKVFKNAFHRVIASRTLTHDTLSTFVCEVAEMMNGRLLTQVSSNFRDMEPITPNHFLLGRPSPNLPPGIFLDKSFTISSSWKQAQQLFDQLRNRFLKEYMSTLLKRGKWSTQTPNLQSGDLWLLDEFTPRGFWPMARVDKVFQGASGFVRSCRLKTTISYIHRPVIMLSKLPVEFVNKT